MKHKFNQAADAPEARQDVYERITAQIVQLLENGVKKAAGFLHALQPRSAEPDPDLQVPFGLDGP